MLAAHREFLMVARTSFGPDVVIAGAARSGTSALAAQLSGHPDIDAGKVKEPNYFSRHLDRGEQWYESNFRSRNDSVLRLDASTSYTSPLFPHAVEHLATVSPEAYVIYSVRRPSERALSHYLLRRHYFHIDDAPTFGEALRATSLYVDQGDYSHWLPLMSDSFGPERLLVVPFELITAQPRQATEEVCRRLEIEPPPDAAKEGELHRNAVVEYRNEHIRRIAGKFRHSRAYPAVRSLVGADRLRRARGLITRPPTLPTRDESMQSCSPDQLAQLQALDDRAGKATRTYLEAQDERLGLQWAPLSFAAATT
jgi:hypothetical protein